MFLLYVILNRKAEEVNLPANHSHLAFHAFVSAAMAGATTLNAHDVALCLGYLSAIVTGIGAIMERRNSRSARTRKTPRIPRGTQPKSPDNGAK